MWNDKFKGNHLKGEYESTFFYSTCILMEINLPILSYSSEKNFNKKKILLLSCFSMNSHENFRWYFKRHCVFRPYFRNKNIAWVLLFWYQPLYDRYNGCFRIIHVRSSQSKCSHFALASANVVHFIEMETAILKNLSY